MELEDEILEELQDKAWLILNLKEEAERSKNEKEKERIEKENAMKKLERLRRIMKEHASWV